MTSWPTSQHVAQRTMRRFKVPWPKPRRERNVPWQLAAVILACLLVIAFEVRTSWLQSIAFPFWARSMSFAVADGPSDAIHFPGEGPFDRQRGYSRIPDFAEALAARNYMVERQAQVSPVMGTFQQIGGFPPYDEKTVTGLTLTSGDGRPYYRARYPGVTYGSFTAIPPLVRDSLVFIENRELLDARFPRHNPAVEWDRFWLAMFKFGSSEATGGSRPGGSTLATQIEKFRHSPEGRTTGPGEKLLQMTSASLRAYREGPNTTRARQRIVVEALDSMPLAAFPRHGEVIGLGDGLRLWYGTDFASANRILRAPANDDAALAAKAQAYKQVLSLIIAQRRPSYLLRGGRQDLERLTDSYLRLMAASGIIDEQLRDAALKTRLRFNATPPAQQSFPPSMAKALSAMRIRLLYLTGTSSLYDLDRLDLTATTTLDAAAQERITQVLRGLDDPENVAALGLLGNRLLRGTQPARVAYSFTLFERSGDANLLRVQTDSLDQPLDLNVGTKLELGSTAKVRTLINYLEIVADLYQQYRRLPRASLEAIVATADPLSRWVAEDILKNGDRGLAGQLQAAMDRTYSAGTGERFFTAGGMHRFSNFGRHGGQIPVSEAIEQSVNLVFIRMMRDIVDYQIARLPGTRGLLENPDHPGRMAYLKRFADIEGRQYLWRFYPQYRNLDREAILARMAERAKYMRSRLAAAYRTVLPDAGYEDFARFIDQWSSTKVPDEEAMRKLYETYAPDRLNLADRSYVASIHPLELWLAGYLYTHPGAGWQEITSASTDVRQESYWWLFKPNRFAGQNRRIRVLLEQQAFERIHKDWQRLGYPFDHLVPSYASAIGTSGDRPDALAQLMGIIVSEGMKLPVISVERLRFGADTPYETQFKAAPPKGRQVLRPEIAAIVRQALIGVVEEGTARRASGVLLAADGSKLEIGAKTGTGDNRTQQFGPGRRLIGSTVRSRTATLMFFIDDRFFGTITAHVSGPEAAQYRFTSALPAQLFKSLAPVLQPMVAQQPSSAQDRTEYSKAAMTR